MGSLLDFDIAAASRRINNENREEDRLISARRAAAQDEGRRLSAAMREKDGAIERVWGFGSTFEDFRPYRMDSDIDLAIEGGDVLSLISITEASSFKVDLIDLTGREDDFARLLRERGTTL